MLVILPEEHHSAWFGEADAGHLKSALQSFPADIALVLA
jgi:hypothetical protein